MSDLGLLPVDVEKSELNTTLNATLFLVFLLGIYTVIYVGTTYFYFTKNSSKSLLVPTAVTMLYLDIIIQTGFQWYAVKLQFIDNGATRDSTFLGMYDSPQWLSLASSTTAYMGFVLADTLLIWRCFFVWNRSFRVISIPLLLIIAEAGLFLVQVAFHIKDTDQTISPATSLALNDLISAAFFTSFATTLVTTVLIAYRIYSVSNQDGVSSRRFKQILDIVLQSGAVYAITILAEAISAVSAGPNNALNTKIFAYDQYIQTLTTCIPGMSATIMVARVALLSTDTTFPSTSVHLSGLQFHARSTHQTNTEDETDTPPSVDVEIGEAHEVQGKVQ